MERLARGPLRVFNPLILGAFLMLNNFRIGLRMGLGFFLVIAVLLATVATAVFKMSQINDDMQTIVNRRFPNTITANALID